MINLYKNILKRLRKKDYIFLEELTKKINVQIRSQ